MNIPKHFNYAGYSDWRVPTIDELTTLRYCSGGLTEGKTRCKGRFTKPTIVQSVFPNTSSPGNKYKSKLLNEHAFVWSSSPSVSDTSKAQFFNFLIGIQINSSRSYTYQVRLVRSGQ